MRGRGAGETGILETEFEWIEHLVDFLNLRETLKKAFRLKKAGYREKTALPYIESIRLMDHGFFSDEKCVGCGTCVRVCPMGNVSLGAGGPPWTHTCEQCFACLQWYPRRAIQFCRGTAGNPRYHHPDVTLGDMTNWEEEYE